MDSNGFCTLIAKGINFQLVVNNLHGFTQSNQQGVKLIFFSDSHLAPKLFKVVANSKKVGHHFQRQTNPFFTLSSF